MKPEIIKINDSVTLSTVSTDKFKIGTLSVLFSLPLERKTAPINTLLLSVLKRGTKKFPTQGRINERLDDLYATSIALKNRRLGDNQLIGFSAEMLDNAYVFDGTDVLDGTFEVICEMLFSPLRDENGCFVQKYVDSEKQNLCDVILSSVNDPRSYSMGRCREIMYADEPYGASLYGKVEDVERITEEELTAAYSALLKNAHIYISYVGKASAAELKEKTEKYFGTFSSLSGSISDTRVIAGGGNVKEIEEEMPVSQGKLTLGFRFDGNIFSRDYPAFIVFNEMFGGSPASKLFLNVREKMSLCYYCSSGIDGYKGTLMVSSGVENENGKVATNAILTQFEALRRGDFTDFELSAAVKSLLNSYSALTDSPEAIMNFYTDKQIFGAVKTIDEYQQLFMKVSREDILRVAEKVELDTVYFLRGSAADGEDYDEE